MGKERSMNKITNNSIILKIFTYFFLLLLIHTTYFMLHGVSAQAINLSISPPLVELLIKPGKSVLVAYTVINNGDPVVISSHVSTFAPKDKLGNIQLEQELLGPVRFNLENSNTALEKSVYLPTSDKQQFLLKIRVPDNAPTGDYYYTFYVKTDSGALFTGQNVSKSTATIGSNILISVSNSGKLESKAHISHFDLVGNKGITIFGKKYHFVESFSKIPFKLVIENKGNNLIKPNGEIVVSGPLGILSKHKVTPLNILAKSSRQIPATPSAELNKEASLTINGFFLGTHRLGATIDFGPGSSQIYASTSFIGIPSKLILGLIVALIVGGVIVAKLSKKID